MKRNLLFATMALVAGSLMAAESSPKDEVTAAAKKLAEKSNYSWKVTTDFGPESQFPPFVSEGRAEKDGLVWLSSTFNDNTTDGVLKDKKVAVKTADGWKSAEEAISSAGEGGFDPGANMARRLQNNFKTPTAEVEDLVSRVKEIKKDGDAYSGELTEDGAKARLTFGFGRRGGQAPPQATNAKGSVKFWIKDGIITKYESKASGRQEFGGEERDIQRNTTIEIKDVGTTKLALPEEAKKKLS